MKKMSEKEAWVLLQNKWEEAYNCARQFDTPLVPILGHHSDCLCHCMDLLQNHGSITMKTYLSMKNKVDKALPVNEVYLDRCTKGGAKTRYLFCRRMARACK